MAMTKDPLRGPVPRVIVEREKMIARDPRALAMSGQINEDPLLEAMMGAPPVEQDGLPLYPSISDVYPPDRLAAERTLPDDDLNDYMSDVDPMRKMKRGVR